MKRNTMERLADLESDMSTVKMMLRIGEVSSVDEENRTVQVVLSNDTASEDLPILNRGDDWMPSEGDMVAYFLRPIGDGLVLGGVG